MQFCQEVTSKEVWESFFDDIQEKTFLQSWNWGEFWQKNGLPAGRQGNKIWRLGIFESSGGPSSATLAVKVVAKRGTFLLVQHGPALIQNAKVKSQNDNSKFKILLDELKKIANNEGCDFIRVAPLFEKNDENEKLFKDLGFRESPMHASAYEATWKLDITPSEEELLANMRKTTRYLIRQAEKNPDIVMEKSDRLSDLEVYQKLNKEVAQRQKFVPFSDKFIKNEFEVFSKPARNAPATTSPASNASPARSRYSVSGGRSDAGRKMLAGAGGDGEAMWFFGKYLPAGRQGKGEVAAGALVIFWSGIGFYHQAASLAKYAKFSIPYLLQWEAIKEAKRRGCKLYDFWGYVDPQKQPKHPWAGPTLFKMGFGGRAYEYMKTQDLPISKKYWLTYIFEKIRKIKRRL